MTLNDPNQPELHWLEMPYFRQEKQRPHAAINIRFEDEDALQEFCRATGLRLTSKTKSAWFPEKAKSDTGMKRWK